jgi:hypothetical protein
MSTKSKPGKGKKKGGMVTLLAVLVALAITLPGAANRSEAGDLSWGLEDIPTRVTTGVTLSGGLDDPGEAGSIGINNILGVVNENLTIPGFVVSWKDQKVLELGVLSGGYSGAAGNDSATPTEQSNGFAFLGVGAYLLEGISANAIYVLDSRAESQFMFYAALDVAKLGPRLVSFTSAAWAQTGL